MKRLFTVCLLACLLLLSFGAALSTATAQETVRQLHASTVHDALAEEALTEEAAEPPIMPVMGFLSPIIVLMITALTIGCIIFSVHKKRRA